MDSPARPAGEEAAVVLMIGGWIGDGEVPCVLLAAQLRERGARRETEDHTAHIPV